jgi:hypothetical protein
MTPTAPCFMCRPRLKSSRSGWRSSAALRTGKPQRCSSTPCCDGNGRTARALFYWAMLNQGYWLFEFISISSVINKARGQYERSFLLSESDDNDLTYVLLAQVKVIRQAIGSLHAYLERKANEPQPSTTGFAAACAEAFRLPQFGALTPEQPWGQPSNRPQ